MCVQSPKFVPILLIQMLDFDLKHSCNLGWLLSLFELLLIVKVILFVLSIWCTTLQSCLCQFLSTNKLIGWLIDWLMIDWWLIDWWLIDDWLIDDWNNMFVIVWFIKVFNLLCLVCWCVTGQTRIFNESEMYQRAFLHWNRAAVQGDLTHLSSLKHIPHHLVTWDCYWYRHWYHCWY